MFDEVHGVSCGVAGVLVLQRGKLWVIKDRKQLVLEGRVDAPVIVVHPSLIHVLSEDSLLLCGRHPCWDV